ncbi:hypothetical protein [Streptomyces sp. SID10815]|uniref:hypothetical protein n=1 Tax=Streptomyces sp. SID10815 TaxID=2706027 RepID=UPI0013C6941E|nr:hypothetical protein [Streptomyces sp. SID10815]NEA47084.1 hypothetical protein [Streptomyces sp. SID10815]
MHTILVVLGALAVGMMVVAGVGAVTTGWMPPPARRRVLRPKLWGYAQLTGAVGAVLWLFLGALPGRLGPLPVIGWCLFMGSLGVQTLARRPGRTPARTPDHPSPTHPAA